MDGVVVKEITMATNVFARLTIPGPTGPQGPAGPAGATMITTQSVVTGSRALGTPYTNGTGKPMFVTVCVANVASATVTAKTDANADPVLVVATVAAFATPAPTLALSFWVLPGNKYKVTLTLGSGTLQSWTEWS